MEHQKGKSNLGGDPTRTPGKREASRLPVPDVEPGARKVPKLDETSIHKGGGSTETEELHLVDKSDGTRWTIQDKTVIDLLKRYRYASDQKTKDEIVKLLQLYVASLSKISKISQASKDTSNNSSTHQPPMPEAADLPKIAENLHNLKLDEITQVSISSTKIQASQSDKKFQDSKNPRGDLYGNRMDADKNSSHQPSMPGDVRLRPDNK